MKQISFGKWVRASRKSVSIRVNTDSKFRVITGLSNHAPHLQIVKALYHPNTGYAYWHNEIDNRCWKFNVALLMQDNKGTEFKLTRYPTSTALRDWSIIEMEIIFSGGKLTWKETLESLFKTKQCRKEKWSMEDRRVYLQKMMRVLATRKDRLSSERLADYGISLMLAYRHL